jgi:hypothetical protein
MAKSYERIHYGLRPAKNIERKMMVEALRRLGAMSRLESYRYIGFGSTYFSDFSMIHKSLGISSLWSIEREIADKRRFIFNKPFNCVRFHFGASTTILPTLKWNRRTIVWLDYEDVLNRDILRDIGYACSNVRPGSVLILSVNATPLKPSADRVKDLETRMGAEKLPDGLTQPGLAAWGTAGAYREIIDNEIREGLSIRSGLEPAGRKLTYRQLFNFNYADGSSMLTVGGVIYQVKDEKKVVGCRFEDLDFVRTGKEPCLIEVPQLTFRELHYLESRLPVGSKGGRTFKNLRDADVQRYSRVYRYFPKFTEAEF